MYSSLNQNIKLFEQIRLNSDLTLPSYNLNKNKKIVLTYFWVKTQKFLLLFRGMPFIF